MSIVRCAGCENIIDLDYDSDVEYVDNEFYHWECAYDLNLVDDNGELINDEEGG